MLCAFAIIDAGSFPSPSNSLCEMGKSNLVVCQVKHRVDARQESVAHQPRVASAHRVAPNQSAETVVLALVGTDRALVGKGRGGDSVGYSGEFWGQRVMGACDLRRDT